MAGTMIAARVVLAMGLAVFAASFPPLRATVLDWIIATDRLPETAQAAPDGPAG